MIRQLSISTLGALEVKLAGEPVQGFEYNKVRALLVYLVVEAGARQAAGRPPSPHSRGSLCALLWPDLPESAARQNLSQALSQLRKVLGDKQAPVPFLLTTTESVQLNPAAPYELDVSRFIRLLDEAEAHPHRAWRVCSQCASKLREAVELYQGDFLTQFYLNDSTAFEEWAMLLRERLRQRALSALDRLVQYTEWRGAFEAAIQYQQRRVDLEPLSEQSQRELIRLFALSGQSAAAFMQYERLRRTLRDELGVEPEAETLHLYRQLQGGEKPGFQGQSLALPGRLPEPPTPITGRAIDLETLAGWLQNGTRLATITGAPGTGKTRLALEIAHQQRFDFEDGVHFIELAAVQQPDHVPQAVAQALEIKEQPRRNWEDVLQAQLQSKHSLLVLDNFEHVLDAAPFLAGLLAACPALKLLVTSRTALHLRAERQYLLEPLPEAEAMQLFAERVQAAQPGFAVTAENASTVRALCRQMDYLPLGIELAAGRGRSNSPLDVLAEINSRLEAFPHRSRDLPERQSTLHSAIAWSYDRLPPAEQFVLASLSIFAGGATQEAVQAVVGDGCPVVAALEALVNASLVQAQPDGDKTRFTLLETIREFAQEQLQALEDAGKGVRSRHAEFFARLAMQAYSGLTSAGGVECMERITSELDNIRLAFQYALHQHQAQTALELATGIWRFYWMRGWLQEGLENLELALLHAAGAPLELQASARRAAGALATGLSEYARAWHHLEWAVSLGRGLPDRLFLQAALTNLGYARMEQGDMALAQRALEESLSLAQANGNPCLIKFPTNMLAGLHYRQGNFSQARQLYEHSLDLNRECQDTEGTANALRGLGMVIHAQGKLAQAWELAEEALTLHQSLQHQLGMGMDYALFGDIARDRGDYAAALDYYQRSLAAWAERENRVDTAGVYQAMAHTLICMHKPQEAAALLASAQTLRQEAQATLTPYEQAAWEKLVAAGEEALGSAAFQKAWNAGATAYGRLSAAVL